MGSFDLNRKYTIEKYCSRIEVAKAIGTNLIEPIWNEIVSYRKSFISQLPIYDAVKNQFYLTYIDSVQQKTSSLSSKISSYILGIGKLSTSKIAQRTFTTEMLKNSLKSVAKIRKIDASEITLQNIVEHKCEDPTYDVLKNYLKCLEYLSNNISTYITEETLASLYAILRGEEELTSFYRISDNITSSSKALVDREYDNGVPAHVIDNMMENLLSFINEKETSLITRIVGLFFMFNYVKPFEDYNLEMAALLSKSLLTDTEIDASAIYLPIESLLIDNEFYGDVFKEVLKTKDFTYAYLEGAKVIINSFDFSLDRIVQVNAHALDMSAKLGEDKDKIKEEFGIDIEEDKPVIPQPVIRQNKPKNEDTKVNSQPKVEVLDEKCLTEREYKKLEEEMLESDPFIKKGQAHFYVRHCTKGRFYTIQQYKKSEGCVYETARTSMDNLAYRGFYRREQIKNKFVYTPIDKE